MQNFEAANVACRNRAYSELRKLSTKDGGSAQLSRLVPAKSVRMWVVELAISHVN